MNLTLPTFTLSSARFYPFAKKGATKKGIIQNQVRTTEYAVIEDTFARRTYDESGDYAVRDFDLDLREHLISGTNRGIYSVGDGGLESKIAAGMGPGKAYVKGYEIETIGTKFLDVNKARNFTTKSGRVLVVTFGKPLVLNVLAISSKGTDSFDVQAKRFPLDLLFLIAST